MPRSKSEREKFKPPGFASERIARWQVCQDIGRIFYYSRVHIKKLVGVREEIGACADPVEKYFPHLHDKI